MAESNDPEVTNKSDPTNVTPQKFSGPEDARKNSKAGKYPNVWSHKTRSGHIFTLDDSNGGEHITLQHRGGSMIQFMPDGAVQFVSHNGQYNFVFGENRVKITGAYDVTVEGGGSLKVDGDYDVTVKGHMNYAVGGDINMTSENFNQLARSRMDVVSDSYTHKSKRNMLLQSTEGSITQTAEKAVTITSQGDSVSLGANKQIGLHAKDGEAVVKSGGKMSFLTKGELAMQSEANDISLKGNQIKQESMSGFFIKSGSDTNIKSDQEVKLTASGGLVHAHGTGMNKSTEATGVDWLSGPEEASEESPTPADDAETTFKAKLGDDTPNYGYVDANGNVMPS